MVSGSIICTEWKKSVKRAVLSNFWGTNVEIGPLVVFVQSVFLQHAKTRSKESSVLRNHIIVRGVLCSLKLCLLSTLPIQKANLTGKVAEQSPP